MKTEMLLLFLLCLSRTSLGQDSPLQVSAGLSQVGFEQKLGNVLPMRTSLIDENGQITSLRKILRNKPAVLSFVYFGCPNLCTLVLNGIIETIQNTPLQLGQDFDLISISINSNDTPKLALAKKRTYLTRLNQRGDDNPAWHFVTATQGAIQTLTQSAGFHFTYDAVNQEYSHPSGFIVITPSGQIIRYFFGIRFSSSEFTDAVLDASSNRPYISFKAVTDAKQNVSNLLLKCTHYNPKTGKYGNIIMKVIRSFGLLAVVGIALLIVLLSQSKAKGKVRGKAKKVLP